MWHVKILNTGCGRASNIGSPLGLVAFLLASTAVGGCHGDESELRDKVTACEALSKPSATKVVASWDIGLNNPKVSLATERIEIGFREDKADRSGSVLLDHRGETRFAFFTSDRVGSRLYVLEGAGMGNITPVEEREGEETGCAAAQREVVLEVPAKNKIRWLGFGPTPTPTVSIVFFQP